MSRSDHSRLERELKALKQRMDALYSLSFPAKESDTEEPEIEEVTWEPLVDIWETEKRWMLIADLPGVLEMDLQVTVIENQLTISGKRGAFPPEEDLVATWQERPSGYFSRPFALPFNIKEEAINAEFKRGVLTISIPKESNREAPSKKIIVHTE